MAKVTSRFLPFVSETATLETIYSKLKEGNSGTPPDIILGVLSTIHGVGLSKVRGILASYNEDRSWSSKFTQMLENNSPYSVPYGTYAFLKLLERWLTFVEESEVAIQPLAIKYLLSASPTEQAPSIFGNLWEVESSNFGIFDHHLEGMFGESSSHVTFESKEDLQSYVFYHKVLHNNTPERIKAVAEHQQ